MRWRGYPLHGFLLFDHLYEKVERVVDESYSEHYSMTKSIKKVGKASKPSSSELIRTIVPLYIILHEPIAPKEK
jgi:hypothetical protein